MKRITEKQLESMVDSLNQRNGKTYKQEGFLQISAAYGGYRLDAFCAPSPYGQGMRAVSPDGYGTKRQLHSFLLGLADQFLEDWAVNATEDQNAESSQNCLERKAKYAKARHLMASAPELLAELEKADKIILELQRFAYKLGAQDSGWPYMRQGERGAAIDKAKGV